MVSGVGLPRAPYACILASSRYDIQDSVEEIKETYETSQHPVVSLSHSFQTRPHVVF